MLYVCVWFCLVRVGFDGTCVGGHLVLWEVAEGNRVQVPVLVRWRFRLEAGEVLRVKVSPARFGVRSVVFFARLQRGGRITVPRVEAEVLGVKAGSVLKVELLAEKPAKNSGLRSSQLQLSSQRCRVSTNNLLARRD